MDFKNLKNYLHKTKDKAKSHYWMPVSFGPSGTTIKTGLILVWTSLPQTIVCTFTQCTMIARWGGREGNMDGWTDCVFIIFYTTCQLFWTCCKNCNSNSMTISLVNLIRKTICLYSFLFTWANCVTVNIS